MNRPLIAGASVLGLLAPAAAVVAGSLASPAGATPTCTSVTTSHGPLTAALVDPTSTVSGTVTPTGCDIGVYFGPGTSGAVEGATVSGFVRYGVYNDGGDVTVEGSTISDIGDKPFDGVQYGLGVYFVNPALIDPSLPSSPATGTISGNVISQYQKGGITVNGPESSADISGNTVTGLGPVAFIAQNGIQIGFGATGSISHNKVSANQYTGPGDTSSAGVLIFGGCQEYFGPEAQLSTGVGVANNTLTNNDIGVALANYDPSCTTFPATQTQDNVVHNTITDDEVTNTTGYGAGYDGTSICGYQAGVSDVGNHDGIKNNSISGVGYGPQTCSASTPEFLYPIDTTAAAAPRLGHNATT